MNQSRPATWESSVNSLCLQQCLTQLSETLLYGTEANDLAVAAARFMQAIAAEANATEAELVRDFTRAGQEALDAGRLQSWTELLRAVLDLSRRNENLRCTRFTIALLDGLGNTTQIVRCVQIAEETGQVPQLRALLDLLPSGAFKAVARACQFVYWTEGVVELENFLTRAAPHQPAAIRDLAEDPDPDLAIVALRSAGSVEARDKLAVIQIGLGHGAGSIRAAAIELARGLPADTEAGALLEGALFEQMDESGRAALYAALAEAGLPEAVDRARTILAAPTRGVLPDLMGRLPGRQRKALHSELIAALAGRAGAPTVRALLETGAESPASAVSRACRKVLLGDALQR